MEEGRDIEVLPFAGPRCTHRKTCHGSSRSRPVRRKASPTTQEVQTAFHALGGLEGFGASGVHIQTAFLNAPLNFLICNPPRP